MAELDSLDKTIARPPFVYFINDIAFERKTFLSAGLFSKQPDP
jgi:hypothetical protein